MKTKKLYKFLREGLKSEYGNHTWKVGEWYTYDGKPSLCNGGFHASKEIGQAFSYVQGEILAEVEVRGTSDKQNDKEAWSEMRIIKAWHWKKENSVAIAIFAAEQVIDIYEKKYPGDDRPRKAIEAAIAYQKNPSEKNRWAAEAAEAAAWAAAWAAEAAEAAGAAAWAAWAAWAAGAAAWAAAGAATRAAGAAAWAAWAATRAAAWAALTKKICARFDNELTNLEPYHV